MSDENTPNIPFIAGRIREAKKMFDVKPPKADKNVIKLEKQTQPGKHKMTPDELQDHFKANRGTGVHKNPADKRKENPNKNSDGW
jgi:hypothetical protein